MFTTLARLFAAPAGCPAAPKARLGLHPLEGRDCPAGLADPGHPAAIVAPADPGQVGAYRLLNPQPLPPRWAAAVAPADAGGAAATNRVSLNPQPLPPRWSAVVAHPGEAGDAAGTNRVKGIIIIGG